MNARPEKEHIDRISEAVKGRRDLSLSIPGGMLLKIEGERLFAAKDSRCEPENTDYKLPIKIGAGKRRDDGKAGEVDFGLNAEVNGALEYVGGERFSLIISMNGGRSLVGTIIGMVYDRIGDGLPNGIQIYNFATWREISDGSFVFINDFPVGSGTPSLEQVAFFGKRIGG